MRQIGGWRRVFITGVLAAALFDVQAAIAVPGRSASPASSPTRPAAYRLSVTVMTYDIRSLQADGSVEGSGRIPPWSRRAPKQAHLIRGAKPDVIAIQEGGFYLPHSHKRQVDSLRHEIGHPYKLARTEIPPNEPHHFRTGNYIIYNSATLRPVGKGWHFSVGDREWAVYKEFASRATGSRFLFVGTHLLVGVGASYDASRAAEANRLLHKSIRIAKRRHVPVSFGGDFNASSTKVGSGKAMHAAGLRDALTVAQQQVNGRYDSDNENLRRPPRNGTDIDHLYVPAGVSVTSAGIVLRLRHGQFKGAIPSDHNPVVAELRYP
jgi:endonuclease/exonuclease/phosphatase family metal-dependent hydrolase